MSTSRFKTIFHILFILSILLATSLDVKPASASTYTVNSTLDDPDANAGDNICQTATVGVCSLRAAIQEANAHAGADTITFSISPDGTIFDRVITIGSRLPSISEQLTIQGPNIGTTGNGAKIVLDGSDGTFSGLWITADNCVVRNLTIRNFDTGIASFDNTGLVIAGNRIGKFGNVDMFTPANGNVRDGIYLDGVTSSVIGGDTVADRNIISGNGANGITILDGAGILVRGNYIGVTETGSAALANAYSGIQIVGDSTGNTIGGSTAARRNIISGNTGDGIFIKSNDNDIFGNYIGLDVSGTISLPNRIGIYLYSDSTPVIGNEIGGTTSGQGNVISGNTTSGIQLVKANATLIKNNIVGLDPTGTIAKPNGAGIIISSGDANEIGTIESNSGNVISGNNSDGIRLSGSDATNTKIRRNLIGTIVGGGNMPNGDHGIDISSAQYATIGGSSAYANVIANNLGNGIANVGANIQMTHNSIYNNGILGINLLTSPTDGVTPNDPNDIDFGANDLQNFPVLTEVRLTSPGQVTIKGYLNSTASRGFNIHVYGNTTCDPSGYGEGQTYINFVSISTASNSYGSFNTTLSVPEGIKFITTTATDGSTSNTSEFSSCTPITQYTTFLPLIIK